MKLMTINATSIKVTNARLYVAVTGKELLMFDSRDVEEAFRRKPFLAPYKAYLDRVRGALYVLKRLPRMLRF
jgi:hypothetical protein